MRILHQLVNFNKFIRFMLPHLVSRENGAEGHNIGNYLGISTAADGFGVGGKAGLIGIDAQKRLNQGAVVR